MADKKTETDEPRTPEGEETDRPDADARPAKKHHKEYDIDIYRAWCKSCGLCAAFCPRNCFSLDEDSSPVISNPEHCTGCGWCEVHCPDFAVSVRERAKCESPAKADEEAV